MPEIGPKCVESFGATLKMVAATESLWLTAPPATEVRKQLKAPQLEALYESAFLRIFTAYENFLEDALTHFMAGYETAAYAPVPAPPRRLHRTVAGALGEFITPRRPYALWHGAQSVIDRSARHLIDCPVETVLVINQANLQDYAHIRHRIAHASRDSKTKFENAALRLTGASYAGKPGKLLRGHDNSDVLNPRKWIRTFVDDMSDVVLQICP